MGSPSRRKIERSFWSGVICLCFLALLLVSCGHNAYRPEENPETKPYPWQIKGFEAALQDPSPYVRSIALYHISSLITKDHFDTITQLLETDRDACYAAGKALKGLGDIPPDRVDRQISMLADKAVDKLCDQGASLIQQRNLSLDQIGRLIDLLKDKRRFVRYTAAETLNNQVALSTAHLEQIFPLLDDPITEVRLAAITALENRDGLPRAAFDRIFELMNGAESRVRYAIADALLDMKGLPEDHVHQIIALFDDKDTDISNIVLKTLQNLGRLPDSHIDGFIAMLGQTDHTKAWYASQVLNKRRDLSKSQIHRILALTRTAQDNNLRSSAASAIPQWGDLSQDHVDHIFRLLEDPEHHTRAALARLLSCQRNLSDEGLRRTILLLADKNRFVQWFAAETVANRGVLSRNHINKIEPLIVSKNLHTRLAATMALVNQKKKSKAYITQLVILVNHPDFDISNRASRIISMLPRLSRKNAQRLIGFMADGNTDARGTRVTAYTLSRRTDLIKDDIDPYSEKLTAWLQNRHESIRLFALNALASQPKLSKRQKHRIIAMLNDSWSPVRSAAVLALKDRVDPSTEDIHHMAAFLKKWDPDVWREFAPAFIGIHLTDIETFAPLLDAMCRSPYGELENGFIRAIAHIMGGGNQAIETTLKWLGKNGLNPAETLTRAEAVQTLTLFEILWHAAEPYPALRKDLAAQIPGIVGQRGVVWESAEDIPLLSKHRDNLAEAYPQAAESVDDQIQHLIPRPFYEDH